MANGNEHLNQIETGLEKPASAFSALSGLLGFFLGRKTAINDTMDDALYRIGRYNEAHQYTHGPGYPYGKVARRGLVLGAVAYAIPTFAFKIYQEWYANKVQDFDAGRSYKQKKQSISPEQENSEPKITRSCRKHGC